MPYQRILFLIESSGSMSRYAAWIKDALEAVARDPRFTFAMEVWGGLDAKKLEWTGTPPVMACPPVSGPFFPAQALTPISGHGQDLTILLADDGLSTNDLRNTGLLQEWEDSLQGVGPLVVVQLNAHAKAALKGCDPIYFRLEEYTPKSGPSATYDRAIRDFLNLVKTAENGGYTRQLHTGPIVIPSAPAPKTTDPALLAGATVPLVLPTYCAASPRADEPAVREFIAVVKAAPVGPALGILTAIRSNLRNVHVGHRGAAEAMAEACLKEAFRDTMTMGRLDILEATLEQELSEDSRRLRCLSRQLLNSLRDSIDPNYHRSLRDSAVAGRTAAAINDILDKRLYFGSGN